MRNAFRYFPPNHWALFRVKVITSHLLETIRNSDHYGIFTIILEDIDKKTLQNKTTYYEICQILKRRNFLIISILNLVISSKIIAIQRTNFLITSYQYLPKWWIYLRPREIQLEKKKSSSSNPGLHLPCLNLFKPKTKCLNVCTKTATI